MDKKSGQYLAFFKFADFMRSALYLRTTEWIFSSDAGLKMRPEGAKLSNNNIKILVYLKSNLEL